MVKKLLAFEVTANEYAAVAVAPNKAWIEKYMKSNGYEYYKIRQIDKRTAIEYLGAKWKPGMHNETFG